jgi:hypothetical protein
MNCFALMYMGADRQTMIDLIDKIPEIVNWRASNGVIFIISEKNENWISEKIHAGLPQDTAFLVSTITIDSSQGYLDKDSWDFIRNPRRVGT